MKKIYYLFCLLPMMPLVSSCDDNGPETVMLQQEDHPLTVAEVTPGEGYVGGQFTITGTEFGGSKEILKVFIGDFEGKVVSCSDTKIVAEVPEEAVSGKIILELVGKKMDTGFSFSVLDTPVLAAEALKGYVNGELTFTGTNMPATADLFTVKFGDIKAEISSYTVDEAGNASMTVKVPQKLSVGKVDLTVEMLNRRIYNKKYEVLTSPIIDVPDKVLTRAGSMISLTGTGFAGFNDKIKVNFNGIYVSPQSVTGNSIMVQVPDEFAGGNVSVEIEGFPATDIGEIQLLTVGDVTDIVLENSTEPFKAENSRLDGWNFNENFTDAAVQSGKGWMFIQCGWGSAEKKNAKVYQTAVLPQGKYEFTVTVPECGSNKGDLGAIFAVTKGNATIPDLVKNGEWKLANEEGVLANCRVTDNKVIAGATAEDYTISVTLSESTEVTMGFVAQITGESYVKFSSIKVSLTE